MLRVLVVDDSPTARKYLQALFLRDNTVDIVGMASDGEEAVKMAGDLRPDVVVMDVYMPKVDGFVATRRIMESSPMPVVLCSAAWGPKEVDKTMQAMQAGAVTIVAKPNAARRGSSMQEEEKRFLQTVKSMAEVQVVRHFPRQDPAVGRVASQIVPPCPASTIRRDIVAIGSSTGGPPVLQAVLSRLPHTFSIPIVIVQHISDGFLPGFVAWLQENVEIGVEIAAQGQIVRPGQVYFAPNNVQVGISSEGRIIFDETALSEEGLRPAISYLFRSVAKAYGPGAVGILLTGMGRDGAVQLKEMLERGALTIAQDRESSAVYGMPREAKLLGAARYVMSPAAIGDLLVAVAESQKQCVPRPQKAATRSEYGKE